MAEIINPYIAGAPVTEQRMFFGREDIFQWIENSIAGQYADHILVVHGQRRVGKTSVLKQLGNRLPKRYIPVFFDLQGRTHTTLDHFLWWLARETVRVLKQERNIEVPPPDKKAFSSDPEFFENQFLAGLRTQLGNNTLLLTFDEFDNLEENEVKDELARPLVDHLRRLMGQPNLNFIFSIGSSGRKLENMQAAYTDFFKTALYKKISFLNEEQTHKLVTRPVEGIIEYERGAVDRIYGVTSGHPYFTQLTCHELFARCQRTEQRKIAIADVEAILDDVVERGTVNLKFVWDEASDIEKWSLAALAQLDKTDNRTVTDYLRKNRVRFSESDLTSGLLHLREKDVITSNNRFVIHLLQIWLQKNRPIEQTREELTEANPIASRFIEIGLEFRDGGQYEKAIEFFRQALSVSADNLQAQVNIAITFATQGQLEQAIIEFEKALTIDDEDVASRSGLCDAHLALGDTAMKRGRPKDAVLSYQRVLAINAEHLEARGRMAELSRQRAEKALTDGKDEEALSAFAEALKFTPEDGSLIARSEKVRAEKNAKVLAGQIARSEKEANARNWDKAIAALNDALEIAPGDESILKKIEAIKEKQLRERLDGLLAKVEAAEKAGRWDTAISTLNEYLQLKPEDAAIQKRIANLVEAKHAAWLNGVMARVDQAVAAQSWDEALSALNEALRLEPENAEMQAKAKNVRESRRLAELNAMLERADQSAGAGRWDEAINILNDGLASDSGNETLKTKLAEARKAKREAHLQAALRLADSAAQAGKWEAAIASLNEVLANEPDNIEFQQKLAEVRTREHQSQWQAARTQSEGLREAERFAEALQIWQDYLSIHPEDREQVDKETKPIAQERELFDLYGNAEGAIAERDFDKAIPLLKEIIIRDENYKDASRLLTKAIELRRTASGQKQSKTRKKPAQIQQPRSRSGVKTGGRRIWIVGLLSVILILGVGGGLFWLGKNNLPAISSLFTNATATPTIATTVPGFTPTTPPLVTENLISPTDSMVMVYIPAGEFAMGSDSGSSNERPIHTVYLDSFWIDQFEVTNKQYAACVTAGICDAPSRTGSRTRDSYYGNSEFDEFPVIYVNWDNAKTYCEWAGRRLPTEAEWEKAARGKDQRTYPWGEGIDCQKANYNKTCVGDTSPVGNYKTEKSPYGVYDMAGNVGEWVNDWYSGTYYQNQPPSNPFGPDSSIYRVLRGGSWLDSNLDIRSTSRGWNYPSGTFYFIGFRCAFTPTLTSTATQIATHTSIPTPTLDPELQAALDTIQSEKPLYQTSFDDWDTDDTGRNAALVNGKLILTSKDENGATLGLNTYPSDSFAVEFELSISGDSSPDDYCVYEVSNNAQNYEESRRAMSALFSLGGQTELDHYVHPDQYLELVTGEDRFDFSKSSLVTLIFLGDQITAFINGQLAYTAQDPAGSAVYLYHGLSAYNQVTCGFDHFKYWDLREMDSAVKIALATIQSEEPLYQTSFDAWEFGDPVENARVEAGKLILTGENQNYPGVHLNKLSSDRFAVKFELRHSGPSHYCTFETYNDGNGESRRGISTGFSSLGDVNLQHLVYPNKYKDIFGGRTFSFSESNTITLIILGDQITGFVNGHLVFTALNPDGSAVYTQQHFSGDLTGVCEYDNFKLWDLSEVDFSVTTTTIGPTSSFASILDSIAGKTPDYEDDFSNLSSGWSTQSDVIGETGYQDGAYFISAKSNNECYGAGLPTNQEFSDFVLEMDVRFIDQGDGTVSIIFRDNGTAHYGANLSPSGWVGFHKNVNGIHIPLLETEIPASSFQSWDTPKHLTLIARQNRMAIYVNGKLFIALTDTSSSQGRFNFAVCNGSPLQALIDNLKIWDITNLSP